MPPLPSGFAGHSAKLFGKLSSFYPHKAEVVPPLISERTAVLLSVLFTVLYIAPFYLSPTLRATPLNSRDAPSVIQARVRAVLLTCIAAATITGYVLIEFGHCNFWDILRLTGIWPAHGIDTAKVLLLVAVLFIGPLFEALIVDAGWRDITLQSARDIWCSWTSYRNLIVAPVSEELVFRSLVIALYQLAKVAPRRIVFGSPLIFGLAHIHHMIEFCNAHTLPGRRLPPTNIMVKGFIRSLFQFTYTSLFGFFAAFVFLRTGSVWSATATHIFCNWAGFPRVWGRVGGDCVLPQDITPDVAQGKRDGHGNGVVKVGTAAMINPDDVPIRPSSSQRHPGALLSVIYYSLLVVGAFGFYGLLWPLTESHNALISIV